MNDLVVGPSVGELVDAGVTSLKIEGRMKGPDYAGAVCRYYRALLDGEASGSPAAEGLADEAALAFSRNRTPGWLEGGRGRNMLNPDFAGATGLVAGRVLERDRRGMLLEASHRLESRDGLLWFGERAGTVPPEAVKAALRFREKGRHALEPGSRAWIDAGPSPEPGSEVRLVSRGGRTSAEVKSASFPPARTEIDLQAEFSGEILTLRGRRDEFVFETAVSGLKDAARVGGRFAGAMEKAFSASGDSDFRCRITSVVLPEDAPEPFVPPGRLKEMRRRFLDDFSEAYAGWKAARLQEVLAPAPGTVTAEARVVPMIPSGLPAVRTLLAAESWHPLPFPVDPTLARADDLPVVDGVAYLPLPPVIFNGNIREALVAKITDLLEDGSRSLCIGLSNQGHLPMARRLAERYPGDLRSGRLGFFLDSSLYTINRAALEWYRGRVPGLRFFVECLEGRADGWKGLPGISMVPRGDGLPIPMFIGRACPVRHAGLDGNPKPGSCPPDCRGSRDFIVSQNGREDRVFIRDCQVWVINHC